MRECNIFDIENDICRVALSATLSAHYIEDTVSSLLAEGKVDSRVTEVMVFAIGELEALARDLERKYQIAIQPLIVARALQYEEA